MSHRHPRRGRDREMSADATLACRESPTTKFPTKGLDTSAAFIENVCKNPQSVQSAPERASARRPRPATLPSRCPVNPLRWWGPSTIRLASCATAGAQAHRLQAHVQTRGDDRRQRAQRRGQREIWDQCQHHHQRNRGIPAGEWPLAHQRSPSRPTRVRASRWLTGIVFGLPASRSVQTRERDTIGPQCVPPRGPRARSVSW